MGIIRLLLLPLVFVFLVGCGGGDGDAHPKVHWDRDMCAYCKMVVSDRHYVSVVIEPKRSKSYAFDDIGCCIKWFAENRFDWEENAKIFISDSKTGEFIDARKAYYDIGAITPMDYGFSAYKNKNELRFPQRLMSFEDVKLAILRGETMQNPKIKRRLQGKK